MGLLTFAYYCSGHGWGHATRVNAIVSNLRNLHELWNLPEVIIVSSAPERVFEDAVKKGAKYRRADIDPVIVQPLAYHVDRRKSVEVLRKFIDIHEDLLEVEVAWLKEANVDCVISDAAFLGCKAAYTAGIPSMLLTNFTFDAVYSYLSIAFPKDSPFSHPRDSLSLEPLHDEPISEEELRPLVKVMYDGYRCANILLRLPGYIPIPSFTREPALPAHLWTDPARNRLNFDVLQSLSIPEDKLELHLPVIPPRHAESIRWKERHIIKAPLIVRHPSEDIYYPRGRKRLLNYIRIPPEYQSERTKILVVSFGGQIFRRPQSRAASRSHSPTSGMSPSSSVESINSSNPPRLEHVVKTSSEESTSSNGDFVYVSTPVATSSHLWIPGAPPMMRSPTTLITSRSTDVNETPKAQGDSEECVGREAKMPKVDLGGEEDRFDGSHELDDNFLPDKSWIAIVVGASPPKRSDTDSDNLDDLPPRFFLAPPDVYMPDLTALADALLGKLGYGTTSECVDAQTPFVFVPRPLFVEEHGLRRLLEEQGVGVELSQEDYEKGEWAEAVSEAYEKGKKEKAEKRRMGDDKRRREECLTFARSLVGMAADMIGAKVSFRTGH